MLDTNTVSHLVKGHPAIASRVLATPMADLCISSITQGELMFGLAKRPDARRLHLAINEFLKRVDVVAWDGNIALSYGPLRATMEQSGQVLGSLDLLIAAHAIGAGAVLVTNDRAFAMVPGLIREDWCV